MHVYLPAVPGNKYGLSEPGPLIAPNKEEMKHAWFMGQDIPELT